ncbi:unnamed protein product [Protopolystoma xenopodis]|uniref:Uncharacterized protein n=1 Tax=Protopolystoma xenopodis TaxID=117903 RepID=A0A3S5B8H6_9PLAT|nr:unnamed protein product [Protopolystoma xenopodis]
MFYRFSRPLCHSVMPRPVPLPAALWLALVLVVLAFPPPNPSRIPLLVSATAKADGTVWRQMGPRGGVFPHPSGQRRISLPGLVEEANRLMSNSLAASSSSEAGTLGRRLGLRRQLERLNDPSRTEVNSLVQMKGPNEQTVILLPESLLREGLSPDDVTDLLREVARAEKDSSSGQMWQQARGQQPWTHQRQRPQLQTTSLQRHVPVSSVGWPTDGRRSRSESHSPMQWSRVANRPQVRLMTSAGSPSNDWRRVNFPNQRHGYGRGENAERGGEKRRENPEFLQLILGRPVLFGQNKFNRQAQQ